MSETFSADFFIGNRQKLRQLFTGTAPIVLAANGQMQREADSAYAFKQDASFWYFTGLDEPNIILVMDKTKDYLIVPDQDDYQRIFDGRRDVSALTRCSGIDTVLNQTEGWRKLSSRLKRAKHLATLPVPDSFIAQLGMYTNPARAAMIGQIKTVSPDIVLLDIAEHVARLRSVKQAPELAAMQRAIDITAQTIKSSVSLKKRQNYAYEYELEAALSGGFRRRGATGDGFEPIVAGGGQACAVHYQANHSPLAADELVLIDVGAEVDHYTADISRTYALGPPSRRQRAVYDAVLEVQNFAILLLKPGAVLEDYEQQVEHYMGEKLRELGLIKSISSEGVRRFYPHLTSHFLGLNTHDVGDRQRPLEPGMVLTVEPGIYIVEEAIGVRIEDDVLITPDGATVLSAGLPRELT